MPIRLKFYFVLILLASCELKQAPKQKEIKNLNIAFGSLPEILDPLMIWNFHHLNIFRGVYSTLTRIDKNGKIISDLAEEWRVSLKDKKITFKLNPKAKFSNGMPVTAQEVALSFSRHYWPSKKFSGKENLFWLAPVDSKIIEGARLSNLKVIDATTIEFHFQRFYPAFAYLLASPVFSIVYSGDASIGSGPMLINKTLSNKESLVLERNPNYFLSPAKVKKLTLSAESSDEKLLNDLKLEKYDLIFGTGNKLINLNQTPPGYDVKKHKIICHHHMYFNFQNKIFKNQNLREKLARFIQKAAGEAASSNNFFLTPSYNFLPKGVMPQTYYSKAGAPLSPSELQTLKQSLKNQNLRFVLAANTLLPQFEGILKANFNKLGVSITADMLKGEDWAKRMNDKSYDLVSSPICLSFPGPDSLLEDILSKNFMNLEASGETNLISSIRNNMYEGDERKKLKTYENIFKAFEQAWNFIPMYDLNLIYLAKKNIKFPDADYRFETEMWNAEEI